MSALLDAANAHRAALLAMDRDAQAAMLRGYEQAWIAIQQRLQQLLRQAAEAKRAGVEVGPVWLAQQDRLLSLKRQVESEIRTYAQQVGTTVHLQQGRAIFQADMDAAELLHAGATEAQRLVAARTGTGQGGLAVSFAELPGEAYTQLVGTLQQGSPLRGLLDALPGEASTLVGDALTAGLVAGLDHRTVSRLVRDRGAMTLRRAQTIVRTEFMRAYRETMHLRYQANADILEGWLWIAGLGPRCCAMCVAMHGTMHSTEERLDDHICGRCTQAPLPRGMTAADFGVQPGAEWLADQPEPIQRAVIGTRRGYEAWRQGEVELSDFVGRKRSEDWGTMRYAKSASDAIAAANARKAA